MNRPYKKIERDRHLPLIGYTEIEAGKRELARALFVEGESETGRRLLEVLRTYKIVDEAEPRLVFRCEADDRQAMIVIRDGREEISTEIAQGELEDPYACPLAVAKLEAYCEEKAFRLRAKNAPEDIPISEIITRYLDLLDPDNLDKRARELRERQCKELNEASPWNYFRSSKNGGTQVIEYVKNMQLGKLNRNFGHNYRHWRQQRPKKLGGVDEAGNMIESVKDGTIRSHLSVVNRAFAWFLDEYTPPIRLQFDMPPIEDRPDQKICLTWDEVRRVILWCLGYVWIVGEGFATEWRMCGASWRLVPVRLPRKQTEYRLKLIRFILIYFLTGTRFKAILDLGWEPMNKRGWIALASCWIYRNGRKTPRNKTKPREAGPILPLTRRLFVAWHARDEALRRRDGWTRPARDPYFYVVHDGRGNPISRRVMEDLVKEAFAAVEIGTTAHKSKHGGVTTYHEAGFPLHQISFFFGTTEDVVDKSYRVLKRAEQLGFDPDPNAADGALRPELMRLPPPNPERLTFRGLVDPRGWLPKVRCIDPPPKPAPARRGGAKAA
ncbi:site-specific integrase [Bradyrhizobium sp. WSM1743]|uniref:site-specific integrase n=1 Tax=Bradyrhizobium sp. WSM1743 TaxID=318996 RepID=UPI00040AA388|nr:site-specific integrase [Bradyrhizobium sp. WSM1743]